MTYSAAPMPEGTPSYQPHMAAPNPGGLAAAFKEPKRPAFVLSSQFFTATVCPILRFVEYVLTSHITIRRYVCARLMPFKSLAQI